MSMSIAIHQASRALAGHATRHPAACVGEALLAVTLLALIGWGATGASHILPAVATHDVAPPAVHPVSEEARPDAPPSWVWDKRVSYDNMLYAFGAD